MTMPSIVRFVPIVAAAAAAASISWYVTESLVGSDSQSQPDSAGEQVDLSRYENLSEYPVAGTVVRRKVIPSLEDLTHISALVVIATVTHEGEVTRTNAGPLIGLHGHYELAVEQYLKGSAAPLLTLELGLGSEDPVAGSLLVPDDGDVPVTVGGRYVMFLRQSAEDGSWTATGFPWVFLVDQDSVRPVGAEVGPVAAAGEAFPTSLDQFVANVNAVAGQYPGGITPFDLWVRQNMTPTGFPNDLTAGSVINPVTAVGLSDNVQQIVLLRLPPAAPIFIDDAASIAGMIDGLSGSFVLEPYVETDLMKQAPITVMLVFKQGVGGLQAMRLSLNPVTGAVGGPRLQIVLPPALAAQLTALLGS